MQRMLGRARPWSRSLLRTLTVGALATALLAPVVGAQRVAAAVGSEPALAPTLQATADQINAAVGAAKGDLGSLTARLPSRITSMGADGYAALRRSDVDAMAQIVPATVADANAAPSATTKALVANAVPGSDPAQVVRQAAAAIDANGPGVSYRGLFLRAGFQAPFGTWTPDCENDFCVPNRYLPDYDQVDLDGHRGNYCSGVPDLWFRFPCYQHDKMYEFAPNVAGSRLASFFAINNKWYADMRTECNEQIRGFGPEFLFCQAVAFTYYIFVTGFSYGIFSTPNGIPGYDAALGTGTALPEVRPSVYRRWNACTSTQTDPAFTRSTPFVSYNRQVLGATATVPSRAVLELSGRVHRNTRLLFEFRDLNGRLMANFLTGRSAADNCIVKQEREVFSTALLPDGVYKVSAYYYAWEGGANQIDVAYNPARRVAHGVPTLKRDFLTLTIGNPTPAPTISVLTQNGQGTGRASAYVVRVRADGSQVVESIDSPLSMGPAGDRVFLVLYARGVGAPALSTVSATIAGMRAPATYAGPSGYAGIEQVNLELPRGLASVRGETGLVLQVGSAVSNTVTIPLA